MKNKKKNDFAMILFDKHGCTVTSVQALAKKHQQAFNKGQMPIGKVLVGVFKSMKDAEACIERLYRAELREQENESRV